MSAPPRRLSSALGPARRVLNTPEPPHKKKQKKQKKKPLPDWSFSVSDLDALKISSEEQERRKASMVSKHAAEAKEELERRLEESSRNPRASLQALEKLAPEEDPTKLKTPAAKFSKQRTERQRVTESETEKEATAKPVDVTKVPPHTLAPSLLSLISPPLFLSYILAVCSCSTLSASLSLSPTLERSPRETHSETIYRARSWSSRRSRIDLKLQRRTDR